MILREFFKRTLLEGGNLEIDGAQAQQIELKVHNRAYIVPILNTLLNAINDGFQQSQGGPLWSAKVLKSRKYLSGSSLHFFNTDIPDAEFERVKPKVGDIDTQINKDAEPQLAQWLNSVKGQVVGNATFLGYSRGNEQYSSLWELTDPPIKVQIDFEFVDYTEKDEPSDWAGFSHSSSWDDLSQGIKGVFHKFLIQAFTKLTTQEFLLRKMVGRGKARAEQDVPTTDNMFSFAVSSKEGGGLRPKYEPVTDEKGRPLVVDGLPVMRALPASGYEKDIGKIFQSVFGNKVNGAALKKVLPKTWSFTGLLDIMNMVLSPEEKEQVFDGFIDKLFAPGAQGLYKGDPQRDMTEKNAAVNYALKVLGITPPKNLEQMRQEYLKNYKVASEGAMGLDRPVTEADEPAVKAQLRKGMPHLRDLKPADFLDLVDELRSEGGRFKLQNIPLNVKVDGFGGRFGKDSQGRPFMGTSRTEPKYKAGFLDYHKEKGTTDPEILGRAANFDKLFEEMMNAIKIVDSKLGPDFLTDKQVTCEVLFLPFATQTEEGKLKFVGIEYDQLPQGVDLVLVPYRIVEASTGKDLPDEAAQQLANLGQHGSVMFMSNRLIQKDGLDVTEIINPLDNLEELKKIVSDTAGKRDRASLELRREVEAKLKPVQIALEKAIDEDPNIIGKDKLGQDYEGIVINSRLGPIKVTSQRQKDIIAQKNAAKAAARADAGRTNTNKTAVVAIGSFVGHKGHEELWDYTVKKAAELGGDPYLFMGNAVGKDDPIPVDVKLQTWHKMYPKYAKNISGTMAGGTLMQKIKHELINPLPGKPPRYDNIVIMVGEDQAGMNIAQALMKAVNKFPGYEHVKVSLEPTPRGTGMSFTKLRNVLKDPNATPEQQYALWSQGFDEAKLGKDWILHLMDITRKGMGITQKPTQPAAPVPVAETRLFNALVRPSLNEDHSTVGGWGKGAYDTYSGTRHGRGVAEMDKSQPSHGRDGKISHSTYGSRDKGGSTGPDRTAKATTADKMMKHAHDVMMKSMSDADKVKKGWRNPNMKEQGIEEYGDTAKGQKMLTKVQKRAVDRVVSKKADTDPAYAKKNKATADRAWDRMKDKDLAEGWKEKVGAAALAGAVATGAGANTPKVPLDKAIQQATAVYNINKAVKKHKEKEAEKRKAGEKEVKESDSPAMAQTARRLTDPKDGAVAKLRAAGDKRREDQLKSRDIAKKNEAMLPKSAFSGSDKNKLGSAGQWKNTGPSKNRPARAGDLVGGAEESIEKEEKQRLDPKCWKGYRKAGTKMKGGVRVNNCVPVSEDVENIFAALIDKIIVNEAIQNNKR